MDGMSREQVQRTNTVANALIGERHMCQDCAVNAAVAMVWSGFLGPKKGSKGRYPAPVMCSDACNGALKEFLEETLGCVAEPISAEQLPSQLH
jgi:hypothetical protein